MSWQPAARPTAKDILRYRYQHGTNLGSIFILEQWLFGGMYDAEVSSSSEHDAIIASLNKRGLQATREKFETHWRNALSEDDLNYLVESAHCNNIRLPIGYFTLGPNFCNNTRFAGEPAQVYVNAWSIAKNLIARCFSRGIGVIIDLHGVPGGANHEGHSGTSSGKAELWGNPVYLGLATRCIQFIADETIRDPQLQHAVVGIQIVNESIIDPPGMYEWYNDVIQRVSAMDYTLPIYISDGWDLSRATGFTRAYNTTTAGPPKTPVFVDCHKYWTFDEKDTSRSPYQIIEQVKHELPELDSSFVGDVFNHGAAVAVYIGEYSLALAPQTWSRSPEDQKDNLMREFGTSQSRTWQNKASGSAFWTYKMEWMPGWEWGFKYATENNFVIPPAAFNFSIKQIRDKLQQADLMRSEKLQGNLLGHSNWWDSQNPGKMFEHWRYANGFDLGWNDAREFFSARLNGVVPSAVPAAELQTFHSMSSGGGGVGFDGASVSSPGGPGQGQVDENTVIGADLLGGGLELWILKRMREERLTDRNATPFGWEWEHGFRQGVREFQAVVGA
ncbi:hypothetical protein, variant [Exophiala mesophila]|nr:hypothetical protein, variant [Exophiala mesophila]KIV88123.1 hypothetical protein, variant [Exophiala mesophila]